MKRLLFFAFMLVSCSNFISCDKEDIPQNFIDKHFPKPDYMDFPIIKGQSNAGGRGIDPARDTVKNAFIMSYNTANADKFGKLIRGWTSSDKVNAFGIQYYLAKEFEGKEVYILQSALGGQPLNKWAVDSFMWKFTVKGINAAKELAHAKGKVARFPYVVFYQGETDAESKNFDSTSYKRALEDLITRTRIETGSATKFFIIQFPNCYRDIYGNMKKLRSIQKIVGSQPNNAVILNSVNDNCLDALHVDSVTLRTKAKEIYSRTK